MSSPPSSSSSSALAITSTSSSPSHHRRPPPYPYPATIKQHQQQQYNKHKKVEDESSLRSPSPFLPQTPPRLHIHAYPHPHTHTRNQGLKLLRKGTLIIGAYPNFYPVCYHRHFASSSSSIPSTDTDTHTHTHFAGLEVDLLLRFCAYMKLKPEFFPVKNFEGIWELPQKRLADVCLGGITSAPTRDSPLLAWSDPYFTVTRTLVYSKKHIHKYTHTHPHPFSLPFPEGISGIVRGTPGSTGYIDAAARMEKAGKRHLLQDSGDDDTDDLHALRTGAIQGMVRGSSVGRALVCMYPEELAMMPPWEILPELAPTPKGEVFCFPTWVGSGLAEELSLFLERERREGDLQRLVRKHRLV